MQVIRLAVIISAKTNVEGLIGVDYLVNTAPDHEETFFMDTLGNRTGNQTLTDGTANFTVQSSTNRYTSIGGNGITHDFAGNTTTDKDDYEYDYENRLVKIEDSSSVEVATHDYDALGQRIRVIDKSADPDVTTLYYYNPEWQVLAEYNGSNELQRYFIYGNYIDEPLVMHRESDSEDYYYAHDHLYSVVALTDDGGDVVERYEYDAYGKVQILSTNYEPRTTSLYGNPYTFTGRRLDALDLDGSNVPQLLKYHLRHRDTNPYTGRFYQQDPRGINPAGGQINPFDIHDQYGDGLNFYAYALGNSLNYTDALGLFVVFPGKGFGDIFKKATCGNPSFGWEVFEHAEIGERAIDQSGLTEKEKNFVEAYNLQHVAIVFANGEAYGLQPGDSVGKKENKKKSAWTNTYPIYRKKKGSFLDYFSLKGCCNYSDAELVEHLKENISKPGPTYHPWGKFYYNCSHWAVNRVNMTKCLCTKYDPTDWWDIVTDPDFWEDLGDLF